MIADTMETSSGRKIVVEKSTVPVRAAESIANILRYTHSRDPDPQGPHVLGHPDPLVRGTDLATDPSLFS